MEREERDFSKLIEKWRGKLPERMTPEEAFRFRTQDGVPLEMLEERVDMEKLNVLMEEHARLSRGSQEKRIFGA